MSTPDPLSTPVMVNVADMPRDLAYCAELLQADAQRASKALDLLVQVPPHVRDDNWHRAHERNVRALASIKAFMELTGTALVRAVAVLQHDQRATMARQAMNQPTVAAH